MAKYDPDGWNDFSCATPLAGDVNLAEALLEIRARWIFEQAAIPLAMYDELVHALIREHQDELLDILVSNYSISWCEHYAVQLDWGSRLVDGVSTEH